MSRVFALAFYNLDNNRPESQTDKEIRALLDSTPAVLGLCETTDQGLPGVDGYRLLRDTGRPGRDNIAAYVKTSLECDAVKWLDDHETWTRTAPGATGQHWPRSILEFRAGQLQVWIAHQPPKGTDNTHDAQLEGIDTLTARMAPWTRDDWDERSDDDKQQAKAQPRVVLWDANRAPGEDGPGPTMLAGRIDGSTIGAKIDGAVARKGTGSGVSYPDTVAGVRLESDHGHAFRCQLAV